VSRVRRQTWRSIIPILTLAAGALFAASASTARGTDLRDAGRTRLTELITAEQRRNQRERADYQRLHRDVDSISRQAGRQDERVRQAQVQADGLAGISGFTPVKGRALRVTLDDAPQRSGLGKRGSVKPNPDDLVVHQQDVQAVVNALWAGGAQGMQIMDQRLISTSAVRCVGNTLILQGVVYSPPFRITAVGDPGRLRIALDASPDIATYKDYVTEYGLGYEVQTLDHVTLPAYTGNVTMEYATVPDSGERDGT
jgi:uncharacterized protein YlxW (UPF0749 family)